jgi:ketosteroid isomerase-like protein
MSSLIIPRILFVVLTSCSSIAGSTPAAPPQPEAALRALNHRFVDAFRAADVDFIDELTDADFVLTAQNGEWLDRNAHIDSMRTARSPRGASYDDVSVRLFGDVAVLHGVFIAPLAHDGVARVRYTDVYRWTGQAWRLVSAQNTAVADGVDTALQRGLIPSHAAWTGHDPQGDDIDVLHELNARYVKAFRDSDAAWYDAHLAPDYVVINSDGSYHDRADALALFARPTFATYLRSFPVDKVTIRRFGDIALIHAENAYERKDGRTGVSRYTDIWHKRDGAWQCVAAHITTWKATS